MSSPRRGEVWLARLSPVVGHEQGGTRPVVVLSTDAYNAGPSGLVVVVPLTSRLRGAIPLHVSVDPPEGGLRRPSVALCDAVRSVSQGRLEGRWGEVAPATMERIADCVAALIGL
jgi:mRNA interferase MazF